MLGALRVMERLRAADFAVRILFDVLALAFLLANLVVRTVALSTTAGAWALTFMAVALAAAVASSLRASLLPAILLIFGASFPLYGFHSYRVQSQAFEYAVTALALSFLLRGGRAAPTARNWPARFWLVYLLLALFSLLLLPARVLEHRILLDGFAILPNMLGAFPRDPLHSFAAVNRLALFLLFVVRLSLLGEARDHYRALFRGITWGAVASVLLGLLDFSGLISLAPYNLSRLFFGRGYQRLQSTFGNPTWFASFLTCALPLVLLELSSWGRLAPALAGAFLPLCAAALFLSAVRASWLVAALLVVLGAAAAFWRPRQTVSPPPPARPGRWTLALAGALVSCLVLAACMLTVSRPAGASLTKLTAEMRHRGVSSPRSVVLAQGLALVRESPVFGSGYETFNLHVRALLGIPASGVARVPNPAAAADPRDTLFDDAHSTYVQVVAGTGVLGLLCWLALAAVCLLVVAGEWRHSGSPLSLAVASSMLVFHVYGLFQGLQYIPVVFFLFFLETGYTMTVEEARQPPWLPKAARSVWIVLAALVLASPLYYWENRGFCNLKERYGVSTYLPEESAEFEGFYGPEQWPQGEFRWMGRRGLVNVATAGPLKLAVACNQPDLEREPVLVSFFFNREPAGGLKFDRPSLVEKRFDFDEPGVLLVTVSRTSRPRDHDPGADRRELGVAIGVVRP